MTDEVGDRNSEKDRIVMGIKFLLHFNGQGGVPFSNLSFYDYKVDMILTSLLDSMRNNVLKVKGTCEGSLR